MKKGGGARTFLSGTGALSTCPSGGIISISLHSLSIGCRGSRGGGGGSALYYFRFARLRGGGGGRAEVVRFFSHKLAGGGMKPCSSALRFSRFFFTERGEGGGEEGAAGSGFSSGSSLPLPVQRPAFWREG
ncbi:hypothetical protein TNCT_392871 [Trichonephila clavata]|uniref:Uncharacterized protein n=1 Tax=Trichonephila clavata TaxID=2740835 RepID=A0A8X6GPK1_TRICU|nr:hypothetical protein TNCT_392871 [Trichonephila clavata]